MTTRWVRVLVEANLEDKWEDFFLKAWAENSSSGAFPPMIGNTGSLAAKDIIIEFSCIKGMCPQKHLRRIKDYKIELLAEFTEVRPIKIKVKYGN